MMKNSKQKYSEYMQTISRSKSFGKFVLIVYLTLINQRRYIFWYFALYLGIINYLAYEIENFLIYNQKHNRGFSLVRQILSLA